MSGRARRTKPADPVAELFAANLIRCRELAGMDQADVAARAELAKSHVSILENGKRRPQIDTVIKLAGALDLDPTELLDGLVWDPNAGVNGAFLVRGKRVSK